MILAFKKEEPAEFGEFKDSLVSASHHTQLDYQFLKYIFPSLRSVPGTTGKKGADRMGIISHSL